MHPGSFRQAATLSMRLLRYPPVFKPHRELEQQACDEQEVGHRSQLEGGGEHARDEEHGTQAGNTPIQHLAQVYKSSFGARRSGLALRYSQFHLQAFRIKPRPRFVFSLACACDIVVTFEYNLSRNQAFDQVAVVAQLQ